MFLPWHEENNTQDYVLLICSDSSILNHPEACLKKVSSLYGMIFHRSNNSAVGHIALRLLQGAMLKVRRIEKPLKRTFKEISHIRSGLKMPVAQLLEQELVQITEI